MVVQRFEHPVGEPLGWPGETHREPPAAVHGVVQPRVGTLEVAIVNGARVGDDVGVVGAGHQDGDPESEWRNLDRHRLTPPLHCPLGRGVRRGGRLTAYPGRAGYQHDAPFARRPHRRQQSLGERDRTQDAGGEHVLPQRNIGLLHHSGRGDPRVVHKRKGRADGLLDRLGGAAIDACPTGRAARRSTGRRHLAAPVASRSSAIPWSGVRIAATTRHPSR